MNIIVVPSFGVIGAGLSMVIGNLLVSAGIYLLARRYFSFNIDWRRMGIFALNCLLPLIYVVFISSSHGISWSLRVGWLLLTLCQIYLTCFSAIERARLRSACRRLFFG